MTGSVQVIVARNDVKMMSVPDDFRWVIVVVACVVPVVMAATVMWVAMCCTTVNLWATVYDVCAAMIPVATMVHASAMPKMDTCAADMDSKPVWARSVGGRCIESKQHQSGCCGDR